MAQNKTLIFIPTYNEVENVGRIFYEIKSFGLDSDILFLDDNSPDRTGEVIDGLAQRNKNIFVIHRPEKSGIGSAHQTGIAWAYEKGYESLITMDCDFTHSPSYIHNFIKSGGRADIITGSRYLQKHSLASWSLFRKTLTCFGHFLTVNLLQMPYDASGAFRLYNLKNIDRNLFHLVKSPGYSFFFESLFILNHNNVRIAEISIELPSRTYGSSKMTWKDAWHSLSFLLNLYKRKLFDNNSLRLK